MTDKIPTYPLSAITEVVENEIRIVTKRDRIMGVLDGWNEQYKAKHFDGTNKREISNELAALDLSTATADDIFNIIGNWSWTNLKCDQCGKDNEYVVLIGSAYNRPQFCVQCISEAYQLLEERTK